MPIDLFGTSHISPDSVRIVRETINNGAYDVVAVELDRPRLEKLLSGDTGSPRFRDLVRAVGVSGALFAKLGHWVEKKLGGRIGTVPGDEMKAAVEQAALLGLKVALIDRPLTVTLKRFSHAFDWRAKLQLLSSLFKFSRVKLDWRGVPDEKTAELLVGELDRLLPSLSRVLVHERNEYMVAHLRKLQHVHPDARILAVVGQGHVPGMRKLLSDVSDSDADGAAS